MFTTPSLRVSKCHEMRERRPKCARCRNHGLVSWLKGHKRHCVYKFVILIFVIKSSLFQCFGLFFISKNAKKRELLGCFSDFMIH